MLFECRRLSLSPRQITSLRGEKLGADQRFLVEKDKAPTPKWTTSASSAIIRSSAGTTASTSWSCPGREAPRQRHPWHGDHSSIRQLSPASVHDRRWLFVAQTPSGDSPLQSGVVLL